MTPLTRVEARVPHPRGGERDSREIAAELVRSGAAWTATVELPAGVSGEFRFAGAVHALRPGRNLLTG